MTFRIAYQSSPRAGEQANGDAVIVRDEGARVMFAVVDGTGHGREAAAAAHMAAEVLRLCELSTPLLEIMESVHLQLYGTRGAAAGVCVVDGAQLTGCAVGNVEIRCVGSAPPIVLSPGVLGSRVPAFRVFHGPLAEGSRLAVFSDGIARGAPIGQLRTLAPDACCTELMRSYRDAHDDASVIVCDLERSDA